MTDFRYAWRTLRRDPRFTLLALLVLALGIGASTAIFSLLDAVVLRSLPYPDPDRLVFVWQAPAKSPGERNPVSYPDFMDWQAQSHSFSHLTIFSNPTYALTVGDTTDRVNGELVSHGYFSMLGIQAQRGRTFLPEEDQPPGPAVALVGDRLWHERFGAKPALVGSTLRINGYPYTVVGILPPGFSGITGKTAVWLPASRHTDAIPEIAGLDPVHHRDVNWIAALGRLKPGVSQEQAQAEMAALTARLPPADPQAPEPRTALIVPLRDLLLGGIAIAVTILLAGVLFVLLISCANLAGLQLVRALAREHEMAVRTAIGASQRRLVRQLLTESLLVSILGGSCGILLAFLVVQVLTSALSAQLPSFLSIQFDWAVLAFGVAVSLATGLIFGIVPALRVSRVDPGRSLSTSRSTDSKGHDRSRKFLVVFETALALALLVSAGLLVKASYRAASLPLGFETANRLVMRLDLPLGRDSDAQILNLAQRLATDVGALPGVRGATYSSDVPFDNRQTSVGNLVIEGRATQPGENIKAFRHAVGPGFFAEMSMLLVRGRAFAAEDDARSAPVAMVSRSFANRYWPGADPVGKRLRMDTKEPWRTVVGVVDDVHYRNLLSDPNQDGDLYLPFLQSPAKTFALVVTTTRAAEAAVPSVRGAVQKIVPDVPVYNVSTLEEQRDSAYSNTRVSALLMAILAAIALLLAAMGIYGLVSYGVSRQTREIGIRIAMGARRYDVLRLVVRQGLVVALVGVAIGLLLAAGLTRSLASLLLGVSAFDPAIFAAVSVVLVAIAMAASYFPARRASRLDPTTALRS
ncbi:MAG TPA: ABC transporter permease [Thermoanaerobaculia bacterium]|nr:ABC transporter permease [Thermoanaerobaculia bacterium]